MQGKNKVYIRNLHKQVLKTITRGQSALILGPRQAGKTTLVKNCLAGKPDVLEYPLQNPEIRISLERDPSSIVRQLKALPRKMRVFVDEAQKVPEIFDSIRYLIDEKNASFIIAGSSARKLKRKGSNLLPGRIKTFRMDPLSWNECGWIQNGSIESLKMKNLNGIPGFSFEKSMVLGSLPGIVALKNDDDRRNFLKAYTTAYIEEEIRAEALSRKIGAFSRFLELAAHESGTNPNFAKLSMEAGVSAPAIKEFYNILEDTLVIERVDPYLRNARKRISSSPRYYFFDMGVRNVLARMPLTSELINSQKDTLFKHAVILEIIRRVRALNVDYKIHYWKTAGGAEVDCVIDTGSSLIPIEIKSGTKVTGSDIRGLTVFLKDYAGSARQGYVVTNGQKPERIADNIVAVPWNCL